MLSGGSGLSDAVFEAVGTVGRETNNQGVNKVEKSTMEIKRGEDEL